MFYTKKYYTLKVKGRIGREIGRVVTQFFLHRFRDSRENSFPKTNVPVDRLRILSKTFFYQEMCTKEKKVEKSVKKSKNCGIFLTK